MKTETKITDITHEDLVDLFSTATYGSNYLSLRFITENDYYGTELEDSNDCWEDKFAKLLIAGGCIEVLDYFAEDKDDFHGDLSHSPSWDGQCMSYTINLTDIQNGLQKALDKGHYEARCARHLIEQEGDLDLQEAEDLMQVIIFGEIIYG